MVRTEQSTIENQERANLEQLAASVRHLRREKGWTQNQLSEHSRVSRATIARIELAQGDVSLSTISKLAWALHQPAARLLISQPGDPTPTIGI